MLTQSIINHKHKYSKKKLQPKHLELKQDQKQQQTTRQKHLENMQTQDSQTNSGFTGTCDEVQVTGEHGAVWELMCKRPDFWAASKYY